MIPAARGADADVPVCIFVQPDGTSTVTWELGILREIIEIPTLATNITTSMASRSYIY